jgi:hypothetical protein
MPLEASAVPRQGWEWRQPRHAIPLHNDGYPVFKSSREDFLAAVRKAGLQDEARVLRPGERFNFARPDQRWR